jgi:hypothetical protein
MECEGLSSYPQEPATSPYPEPDESSPNPRIRFLLKITIIIIIIIIIIRSMTRTQKVSSLQVLYEFLISPMRATFPPISFS